MLVSLEFSRKGEIVRGGLEVVVVVVLEGEGAAEDDMYDDDAAVMDVAVVAVTDVGGFNDDDAVLVNVLVFCNAGADRLKDVPFPPPAVDSNALVLGRCCGCL